MARLAAAILAIAIISPAQAQARTPMVDPLCRDLRRIVAAAGEEPPFAALPSSQDPIWMGGQASCRRGTQPSVAFYCQIHNDPAPGGREALAARTQRCLADAVRVIDDSDSRDHHDRRLTRLRSGPVIVDVSEHGGPCVHIGWYYSIKVRSASEGTRDP